MNIKTSASKLSNSFASFTSDFKVAVSSSPKSLTFDQAYQSNDYATCLDIVKQAEDQGGGGSISNALRCVYGS